MAVDFKKLLPVNMRDNRWGEVIEVIQDIMLNDLKPDKIDIIKTQFDIDQMTYDDYVNLCAFFGYTLLSYGGYGESDQYLTRQVNTLTERIVNKTTRRGYYALFYIYNLIGNFYPLYEDQFDNYTLKPIEDWLLNNEVQGEAITLDADDPITIDSDEFITLDYENEVDSITRHLLFSYEFKALESANEFISENTMSLYAQDINIQKRKTEVPYFEPHLQITHGSGVTGTSVTIWNTYDGTDSGIVQSRFFNSGDPSMSGIVYIHLGSGIASGVADGSIPASVTDVAGLETEILASNMEWSVETNSGRIGRMDIIQKQQIGSFKEMALLDINSGIVMYATFPEIIYLDTMNSGFYLDLTMV